MKYSLLFLILLSGVLSACQDDSKTQKRSDRPNVVLILTDDQGYADAGVFGATDFETPYLDQLASEGALLTHYYAPQAVCSASRAGILTGCYPNRIGIHNALMPNSDKGLHPDETTIADMLKEKGYATAIFGKWHLGDNFPYRPEDRGFDEVYRHGGGGVALLHEQLGGRSQEQLSRSIGCLGPSHINRPAVCLGA